jgi:hypothetical protein
MLIRLLMIFGFLILLAWVGMWFLRRSLVKWLKNVSAQVNVHGNGNRDPQAAQKLNQSETLVKCAYCSTFIPKNRAIIVRDEYYCCEEHTTLPQ